MRSVPLPGRYSTCSHACRRSSATAAQRPRFQGPAGTPIDGSALYRRYREFQNDAGVRALRFHDL